MSVWLVVPMKSLREGKSRLAPALDPMRRRAFLERLLLRTLERAAQFPGLERTLLVSGCSETRTRAAEFGAQVLEERACVGLNGALRQAQLAVRRLGALHMLVVPCDLPLLDAEDLRRLAEAGSAHSVGIAPDRARQGTNGLCLEASLEFAFSFGPGSFVRHLEHVRQLGMQCVPVESAGLAFDVDLPEDLAHLDELERADHASIIAQPPTESPAYAGPRSAEIKTPPFCR
jgi:2-phospho-L-lactate guanylyltransferase